MAKCDLDNLIKQYKVQAIGWGYIDCIVSLKDVFDFIKGLSNMGIKAYGLTWWCHCKSHRLGCPHGMGGPRSDYYDGWFSEMWFPLTEFESNEQAVEYLKAPNDLNTLGCFVPALWLDVPNDWVNEQHKGLMNGGKT